MHSRFFVCAFCCAILAGCEETAAPETAEQNLPLTCSGLFDLIEDLKSDDVGLDVDLLDAAEARYDALGCVEAPEDQVATQS